MLFLPCARLGEAAVSIVRLNECSMNSDDIL
jgi:hypothetical protein